MKYISFLFILLVSCSPKNSIEFGKYKTLRSNRLQGLYNKFFDKCNILGDELDLNKDSTFYLSTCSYNATGNWNVSRDTLFLDFLTDEVYVDSLVGYRQITDAKELKEKSEYYLIKNKKLFQYNETKEFGVCTTKLTLIK
jgi:hypothetical protein